MEKFIAGSDFHSVWDILVRQLLQEGKRVGPRGLATAEHTGISILVEDLRANILVNSGRDLNYRFMVAEWLWISLGYKSLTVLERYNKRMREFSDDGETLYGAYGPRIGPQLDSTIVKLVKDPSTRQAVITIYRPNEVPSKDTPCTLTLQFLIRDGRLNCIANMRSSDVWLGLPYDFFTFSQLTNSIAGILHIPTGSLQMNLGSSHLYEQHFEPAWGTADWNSYTLRSPQLDGHPPKIMCMPLEHPEGTLLIGDEVWKDYANVLRQPTRVASLGAIKKVKGTE